jgi:hypothetical protein
MGHGGRHARSVKEVAGELGSDWHTRERHRGLPRRGPPRRGYRAHQAGRLGFTSFRNYRIRSLLYAGKPNWVLLATVTPR